MYAQGDLLLSSFMTYCTLHKQIGVRMRHLPSKLEWILDKSEFFERLFVMREMFDGQTDEDDEEQAVSREYYSRDHIFYMSLPCILNLSYLLKL